MLATLGALVLANSSWTMVLGGDIMLNGIRTAKDPFGSMSSILKEGDVTLANLEIPLTRAKSKTSRKSKRELEARTQFVLKAEPSHIKWLTASGIDMVSLGNNHAMDYGSSGLDECLELLNDSNVLYAGAGNSWPDARKTAVFTLPNRIRVGLVSFLAFVTSEAMRKCHPATKDRPGIAVLPLNGTIGTVARSQLAEVVRKARLVSDVVVVGLHWGVERQTVPASYQVKLGRAFVDAGADVVWGHHPHVLQGTEIYRDKPIIYSTGNLISAMPAKTALYTLRFTEMGFEGLETTPCRINGGVAEVLTGKSKDSEQARIKELNNKLATKFPSKRASTPANWVAPIREKGQL